ncbi:MAG: hypothetical protein ACEROO_11460, partial [Candidatus Bathyarchaeota archaeon]
IEMFDTRKAHFFADQFAGFTFHSGGSGGPKKHELYSGLYNLTFYGKDRRHFEFNMPFKERYKTELLSEAQCIEKANQLIEEIKDYYSSSLDYARASKVVKVYLKPRAVALHSLFYLG